MSVHAARPHQSVCIVAPIHRWDDVRVFQKQAVSLAGAGYDVTLICQAPHDMQRMGVSVRRAWALKGPRLLRALCLPCVLLQALLCRASLYHLHNPGCLPIALTLYLLGRKTVYDTHEDFSVRILARAWIPKRLRRPLAWLVACLEPLVAARLDGAIATQPTVVSRLGNKCVLIGNPPRVNAELFDRVRALSHAIPESSCRLRLIYLGVIARARGLFEMVEALNIANRTHPGIRLWLLGTENDNKTDIDVAQHHPGWEFVDFVGRLPQEEAFAYLSKADIGLVVIHDVSDHRRSDPNKLYEYMAFGKPFIASDFPEWRRRLQDYEAGWFVPPQDVESLVEALKAAAVSGEELAARGREGRRFVESYNWEREAQKLFTLYRGVLSE